jgi:hypothetical protein
MHWIEESLTSTSTTSRTNRITTQSMPAHRTPMQFHNCKVTINYNFSKQNSKWTLMYICWSYS